jgi:hypothetical protein
MAVSRLLVAACLMIAGTQAAQTNVNLTECSNTHTVPMYTNQTFSIVNNCSNGEVTYRIILMDDTYQAFRIQLTSGSIPGVNRKGVVLSIRQALNDHGIGVTYIYCSNGSATQCSGLFVSPSITTHTYRILTIYWETPAAAMSSTLLITPISTVMTDNTVTVNTASSTIKAIPFENTRQIFKLMLEANDTSYDTMFNVLPNNATFNPCILKDPMATLKMWSAEENGTLLANFACNSTVRQQFKGTVFLEYKATGVTFSTATFTGQATAAPPSTTVAPPPTTAAPPATTKSATRTAFNWAATALLIVYQIMVKH